MVQKTKPRPLKIKSGKLYSLNGRSRAGKTIKAMQLINALPRCLIWDVDEQYEAHYRAYTLKELTALLARNFGREVHIAYTSKIKGRKELTEDFNGFCRRGVAYVQRHGYAEMKTSLVFEETARVTSSGYAPPFYVELLSGCLKYGCDLIAITQRLAESDKTSIGNASIVHVCALRLPIDRKSVADATGVPLKLISSLVADQDNSRFEYITVDGNKNAYQRGQLTFKNDKPVFTDNGGWVPI